MLATNSAVYVLGAQKTRMMKYSEVSWTFLDSWRPSWMELSFPTVLLPLTRQEIRALLLNDEDAVGGLTDRLAIALSGKPKFIRLSTRSPKDITFPDAPITSCGRQAVTWLRKSGRIQFDLRCLMDEGLACSVALREPFDLDPRYEFRAFVRGGKFWAVSQYFRFSGGARPWREAEFRKRLWEGCRDVVETDIAPYTSAENYVVDFYCPNGTPKYMIEVNPYSNADGGCAEIDEIEAIGGLFIS